VGWLPLDFSYFTSSNILYCTAGFIGGNIFFISSSESVEGCEMGSFLFDEV
jgi:hypothetical protein